MSILPSVAAPVCGGPANNNSGVGGGIYDTWSTTCFGTAWNNGSDDREHGHRATMTTERTNPPPYAIPLRGIQVKIRAFEPDTKQIREVTVEQDFLPQ